MFENNEIVIPSFVSVCILLPDANQVEIYVITKLLKVKEFY